MNDRLQLLLETLPDRPGVYLMKDAQGTIIYVGKAISLKNRVRQYFHASGHGPKVLAMVEHVDSFDTVMVDNEVEALLLECTLIKKHKPYYNILLRDDKHYPYIRIDMTEDYPTLEITRKVQKDKARYFGPYLGTQELRRLMETLKKAFAVRSCHKNIARVVGKERPCLNFQIGQCMAPCSGKVTPQEYKAVMQQVCHFLDGHEEELLGELRSTMTEASEQWQFERAAMYRDRIAAVEHIMSQEQKAITDRHEQWDVLGLARGKGKALVQLLIVRNGRLTGSDSFHLDGSQEGNEGEALGTFIQHYYQNAAVIPKHILTCSIPEDAAVLEAWLSERRESRVYIQAPQRGDKHQLVEMATRNAEQIMVRESLSQEREWERTGGAVRDLAAALELAHEPCRMEAFDISNIQGTESVASMVVFEGGKPAKSDYRRFKIKTVEGANDFASMAEVISRRFKRYLTEKEEGKTADDGGFSHLPDLVLIDGGPGQLSAAREAMRALGMQDIPTIGLAKREEEIYREGYDDPLSLPMHSPALHLLQRIRDEAHRFAITYHRSLRGQKAVRSVLDDIAGIGPARRKALMKAYPSLGAMCKATAEELAKISGMNAAVAEKVHTYLHEHRA